MHGFSQDLTYSNDFAILIICIINKSHCERFPPPMSKGKKKNTPSHEPIAVIGIGCRFPGELGNADAFWKFISEGGNAISEIPPDRWNIDKFYSASPGIQGKYNSRYGGFIRDIHAFDAGFFGISPREARQMDPHQKILLEVAWQAFEDAGLVVDRKKTINAGVFVGISNQDFGRICHNLSEMDNLDTHHATGISFCIAANRISYVFNLTGPSFALDTACSSSLVAVHLACSSLRRGECEFALAGGANIILNPETYVSFCNLSMLSPDGRCHAFDARANGFVRSEGAGLVILMPLSKAVTQGREVYAVIRETGINQDGHTPGITVPNRLSQEKLMRQVYRNSGIKPGMVSFVEAHGTGTAIGDPVEAEALGKIIGAGRPLDKPSYLGSVKTNIGHLESAAGIAGLIKAALVIKHKKIPPNLHFVKPNPKINFRKINLKVPKALIDWPKNYPQYAAVNSFGFGGTNAHIVLSAAPEKSDRQSQPVKKKDKREEIFCVSAHDKKSINAYVSVCRDYLKKGLWKDWTLNEICGRSWKNRMHHDHRLCAVVGSKTELKERLSSFQRGETTSGMSSGQIVPRKQRKIVFVFSGQGPQWWAMGQELFANEPVFRETIIRCHELMSAYSAWSLLEELRADEKTSRLHITSIAQPSIIALQIALMELWKSWGVNPDAVVGHSVGEVTAAYAAGILSLDDALRVIYHRGRCMERAGSLAGKMLAVGLSPEDVQPYVKGHEGRIHVGAINSPESVTLSGDSGPIEEVERKLANDNIFFRMLKTGYAFHSHHMDGLKSELMDSLKGLRTYTPKIPAYSSVRGAIAEEDDFLPEYWWKNVREQVKFSQAIDELIQKKYGVFIEISPHPVLLSAITECLISREHHAVVLPSLRRNQAERFSMLSSFGKLHTIGVNVNWNAVYSQSSYAAKFPNYAWNHDHSWHQSDQMKDFLFGSREHPLLGTRTSDPSISWETRINDVMIPFLKDHNIHDQVLLPSTVYLELAWALSKKHLKYEFPVLADVSLVKAAFVQDSKNLTLRTHYDPEEFTFKINSSDEADGKTWHLNGYGSIYPPQKTKRKKMSLDELRSRFRKRWNHKQCYDKFKNVGIDYGPIFRGITRLYLGKKEALAEIVIPETIRRELKKYRFHPVALDMCLQAIRGIIYKEITWIPIYFRRIQLHGAPVDHMWSYVHDVKIGKNNLEVSITILDNKGGAIADIQGILLKGFEIPGTQASSPIDDMLYNYEWIHEPLSNSSKEQHPKQSPHIQGTWLIFTDNGNEAALLARRLRDIGLTCISVTRGHCFKQVNAHHFTISPTSRSDLKKLIAAVIQKEPDSFKGVIHFWGLDVPQIDSLTTLSFAKNLKTMILNYLFLLQESIPHETQIAPRIYLITRGAQSVENNPEPVSPLQASVWGLGRVIVNEYPRFRCTLIDLDAHLKAENMKQREMDLLRDEIIGGSREDEIAFRKNKRYFHRLRKAVLLTTFPPKKEDEKRGEANFRLEISNPGMLDNLLLRQSRRISPKEGEIEIRVHSAGLNFSDVMKALNLYPGMDERTIPLGIECAGVISRVGKSVKKYRIGERVMAIAPQSFSAYVNVPEGFAIPLPNEMSFEEGATLPLAFLTATYTLIHLGKLRKNERVLIHSASGGVGMAAVQIAEHIGAEIFATAGTTEKRTFLTNRGIKHVMDSRSLAFSSEIMKRTDGQGIDLILNSLSGRAISEGLSILRDCGRFLEIGKTDIYQNKRIGLLPFRNDLSFFSVDLEKLMRERSSMIENMLHQLSSSFSKKIYVPLPYKKFPISRVKEAFRYMAQAKHIGKIVITTREKQINVAPAESTPVRVRSDASYLVTGGFGGFGLTVAQWMVDRGARHIALMGRRGAVSSAALDSVKRMKNSGAQVLEIRGDVSKKKDVDRAFAEIKKRLPEVRGVVHAAMVLDDAVLSNLTPSRLQKVMDPKVLGAWHLHQCTKTKKMDFFVLFSSVSSLIGMPGQGSYVVANAFLDGLSHYRRAHDQPGISVNWGYLGEVGVAARNREIATRFENYGLKSFSPVQAMELFSRVLECNPVQMAVMNMNWTQFREIMRAYALSRKFSELWSYEGEKREAGGEKQEKISSIWRKLVSAEENDWHSVLMKILHEQISKILGTSPSRIDIEKPLTELGFDSLMAVELRNWIANSLGVFLPTIEIMRGPSVKKLGLRLQKSLSQMDEKESFSS